MSDSSSEVIEKPKTPEETDLKLSNWRFVEDPHPYISPMMGMYWRKTFLLFFVIIIVRVKELTYRDEKVMNALSNTTIGVEELNYTYDA
jgi:hypothetical protein